MKNEISDHTHDGNSFIVLRIGLLMASMTLLTLFAVGPPAGAGVGRALSVDSNSGERKSIAGTFPTYGKSREHQDLSNRVGARGSARR